jgi:hypothetical protein
LPREQGNGPFSQKPLIHVGRSGHSRSLFAAKDSRGAFFRVGIALRDRLRFFRHSHSDLFLVCVWDFAVFGRGTPAPIDPPKKLIVHGLYRYTRNPMYLGVLTVIGGWAILFKAITLVFYAMIVGACCHLFIVFNEDSHLQRKFGKEYEDYRAQVNRWLPKPGHQ